MLYGVVEVNESCKKEIVTKRTCELGKIIPKSEKEFGWKEIYVNNKIIDYFISIALKNGWDVTDDRV